MHRVEIVLIVLTVVGAAAFFSKAISAHDMLKYGRDSKDDLPEQSANTLDSHRWASTFCGVCLLWIALVLALIHG